MYKSTDKMSGVMCTHSQEKIKPISLILFPCYYKKHVMFFLSPQVMILTGEGGKLKRNIPLCRGRDFEILPESVWRALQQWYGGGPALPRTVKYIYYLSTKFY